MWKAYEAGGKILMLGTDYSSSTYVHIVETLWWNRRLQKDPAEKFIGINRNKAGEYWDAHGDLEKNHNLHAGETDMPIAGLLTDLKQRGLLDSTLIIWGGEFGRQPTAEYAKGSGRDHHAYGFTMWMAGGGIKGGTTVGTTDELGSKAVEKPFHVKHLHATVLDRMGLDPERLTYFYGGLDQKLVGVEGAEPIKEILV